MLRAHPRVIPVIPEPRADRVNTPCYVYIKQKGKMIYIIANLSQASASAEICFNFDFPHPPATRESRDLAGDEFKSVMKGWQHKLT